MFSYKLHAKSFSFQSQVKFFSSNYENGDLMKSTWPPPSFHGPQTSSVSECKPGRRINCLVTQVQELENLRWKNTWRSIAEVMTQGLCCKIKKHLEDQLKCLSGSLLHLEPIRREPCIQKLKLLLKIKYEFKNEENESTKLITGILLQSVMSLNIKIAPISLSS